MNRLQYLNRMRSMFIRGYCSARTKK